jgi:hypothetical protein
MLIALAGRCWAVTGELADQVAAILDAGPGALRQLAELRAVLNAYQNEGPGVHSRTAAPTRRAGEVAVVPVVGLLTHRGAPWNARPPRPLH